MRWLLAVLAALLAFVALASIGLQIRSSEEEIAKSKRKMRDVEHAIETFRMEENHLPASLSELCGDDGRDCFPEGPPTDPWGNEFVYTPRGKTAFDLVCLGSDGVEGGEGDAKDITLADLGAPADGD